jgi:hypothetical protein
MHIKRRLRIRLIRQEKDDTLVTQEVLFGIEAIIMATDGGKGGVGGRGAERKSNRRR